MISARQVGYHLNNEFNRPFFEESQNWPYPYTASAALVWPLLWAVQKFGRANVMKTYLKGLANLKNWRGYRDWAEATVDEAATPEIKEFLNTEHTRRGFFTASANP